jgi:hypothetical protein
MDRAHRKPILQFLSVDFSEIGPELTDTDCQWHEPCHVDRLTGRLGEMRYSGAGVHVGMVVGESRPATIPGFLVLSFT